MGNDETLPNVPQGEPTVAASPVNQFDTDEPDFQQVLMNKEADRKLKQVTGLPETVPIDHAAQVQKEIAAATAAIKPEETFATEAFTKTSEQQTENTTTQAMNLIELRKRAVEAATQASRTTSSPESSQLNPPAATTAEVPISPKEKTGLAWAWAKLRGKN